jgi:hypothetical protein
MSGETGDGNVDDEDPWGDQSSGAWMEARGRGGPGSAGPSMDHRGIRSRVGSRGADLRRLGRSKLGRLTK